jgi:GNAT superfamily N-acetyltransferase
MAEAPMPDDTGGGSPVPGAEGDAMVADLLAEALEADPFYRWMWSTDPEGVRAGLRAWMQVALGRLAGRAEVAMLEGSAAAIWIHPDRPLVADDYAAVGALLERRIGERAASVMRAIAATAPFQPETRHRILLYVGVRPGSRSQGLGTRLVAHGLAAADAEHLPVSLTSTNERNLPFYARLGFEILAEVPTEPGIVLRPMWRQAR